MCPDYRVSHHAIFANSNQVAVFGEAGGTIAASDAKLSKEKPLEHAGCVAGRSGRKD